jgi:hypothetical protein
MECLWFPLSNLKVVGSILDLPQLVLIDNCANLDPTNQVAFDD